MKRIALIIVIMSLTATQLMGQARKYSNEFLAIGVSARALGMGNATVATVSDVTAGYWNPAGLTGVTADLQVGLMHAEYFAGIAKYDYGAVALPSKDKKRTLGVSLIRFAVDDIPNTLFLIEPDGTINYDNVTAFSVADYALLLSYAQPIRWNNLQVGGNLKIIHRTAGAFARAWGFGLDVGAQWKKGDWRLGLTARDITTTFNAWSFSFTEEEEAVFALTNNIIPENSYELTLPRLIAGGAWVKQLNEKMGLTTALDLEFTTDGKRNVLIRANPVSIDPRLGLEFNYMQFLYLRAGIGNIQRSLSDVNSDMITTFQPNMGVGIKIKNLLIDYAYTDIGNQSQALYSHVFSLRLDVNKRQ